MGYGSIDQAVKQYSPAGDRTLYGVEYEARISAVPAGDYGTFLIPCHAYSSADHMADKGAIMHRNSGPDFHEAAGAYFGEPAGLDGENYSIPGISNDDFVKNKLQVDAYGNWTALVEADTDHDTDYVGTWAVVGSATDTTYREVVEIDFMAELQYDSFDYPDIDKGDNRIIVGWVVTDRGFERPATALGLDGDQQGEYARISDSVDSNDRLWFDFWWE